MARSKKPEAEEPAEETVTAITKSAFMSLFRKVNAAQREMDAERSSIGGMVSDAVEHKNLHKAAFAWCRRINKMSDTKRAEFLFSMDLYRSWFPDWTSQGDMLRGDVDVGEEPEGPSNVSRLHG